MDATNEGGARGLINRVVGGRYEVLESVGDGPLLQAFRARDRQLNRIVALKAVRPAFAERQDIVARLREGFTESLSLHHEAIARGYDVGNEPGVADLYYAEEFVRGIDLKERIRRGAPFQLTIATDIALALTAALEYAHGRGVPHGDLRPAHVLIGPENQIKLTGFGAATAFQRVSAEDPTALAQSVPYTAPDLATSGVPTASADLYALAVILYEMLTGDPPFRGDNPVQVALRHAQETPVSPRTANQAVPRALEGIILKGLGKQPQQRYGSATELLGDLKTVREALQFGRSLSWSPLDPPAATPATSTPAPAPPPVAATVRREAPPRKEPAPVPVDEPEPPRRRGFNWWAMVPLVAALALVGSILVVVSWVRPYLTPAPIVLAPNLVGKSLTEAQSLAADRGFRIEVIDRQFRDDPPADVIYQMRQKEGEPIREGQPIAVWVSRGPEMVEVPDISRMSLEKARQILEKAGLKLGTATRQWDFSEPIGNVVDQLTPAGERKPRGTRIDVNVSKGTEPAPTPEPIAPDPTPAPEASPTPDAGSGASDTKERVFELPYKVPKDGRSHHIRVDVEDLNGLHTSYDETHSAGETLRLKVTVVGKPFQVRLYDNDALRGTAP